MNMSATNPPSVIEDELSKAVSPPAAPVKVTTSKNGMVSALVIALIAVAAWFFFTNLFPHPSTTVSQLNNAPAPVSATQDIKPLFVPPDSQSQPPVISLPVVETGNDAPKPPAGAATEPPPENTAPTTSPTSTAPARLRSASNNPRRLAAQKSTVRLPSVEQAVAAIKPGLPPRTLEPEAPAENSARSTPITGSPNPRLDTSNELRDSSRASAPEPGTTIINYSGYSPDPDSPPIDFASISAVAPTPKPKPPTAKPVRQTSGLVVIVNKANSKSFSRSDISNIYRDRITRWPSGERILVLNLPLDSTERQRFSTVILDMSPLDAATEGSNRTITNRVQNEYRTKNAQVVVSYIERHENAIGYVQAAALTENDNVRVVYSIP